MARFKYSAYGLTIFSEIKLSPLMAEQSTQAPSKKKRDSPSVTIVSGSVPPNGFTDSYTKFSYCHVRPEVVWLKVPNVARFLIEKGQQITFASELGDNNFGLIDHTAKKFNQLDIALFILAQCIPYILMQRGYLVLRASAVAVNGKAVLFAGSTQSGKTTYAAALHNRGFDVISDDISVIDESNRVLPGYPYLKIWANIVRYLRHEISSFTPIRPDVEKYWYPLTEGFCSSPLPLHHVYCVNKNRTNQWQTKKITGIKKTDTLNKQRYRPVVHDTLEQTPLFPKLLQLATQVSVTEVAWPNPLSVVGKKPRIAHQLQYFLDQINVNNALS